MTEISRLISYSIDIRKHILRHTPIHTWKHRTTHTHTHTHTYIYIYIYILGLYVQREIYGGIYVDIYIRYSWWNFSFFFFLLYLVYRLTNRTCRNLSNFSNLCTSSNPHANTSGKDKLPYHSPRPTRGLNLPSQKTRDNHLRQCCFCLPIPTWPATISQHPVPN